LIRERIGRRRLTLHAAKAQEPREEILFEPLLASILQ